MKNEKRKSNHTRSLKEEYLQYRTTLHSTLNCSTVCYQHTFGTPKVCKAVIFEQVKLVLDLIVLYCTVLYSIVQYLYLTTVVLFLCKDTLYCTILFLRTETLLLYRTVQL